MTNDEIDEVLKALKVLLDRGVISREQADEELVRLQNQIGERIVLERSLRLDSHFATGCEQTLSAHADVVAKCVLCDDAAAMCEVKYRGLLGIEVPQRDQVQCFVIDLAILLRFNITKPLYDSAHGFTFLKNSKKGWHDERNAIAIAYLLNLLSHFYKVKGVCEGDIRHHLVSQLKPLCPASIDLVKKIGAEQGDDWAAYCVRAGRIANGSIRRAGLVPKFDDLKMGGLQLPAAYYGAVKSASVLLEQFDRHDNKGRTEVFSALMGHGGPHI